MASLALDSFAVAFVNPAMDLQVGEDGGTKAVGKSGSLKDGGTGCMGAAQSVKR